MESTAPSLTACGCSSGVPGTGCAAQHSAWGRSRRPGPVKPEPLRKSCRLAGQHLPRSGSGTGRHARGDWPLRELDTSAPTQTFSCDYTAHHWGESWSRRWFITRADWNPSDGLSRPDLEPNPFLVEVHGSPQEQGSIRAGRRPTGAASDLTAFVLNVCVPGAEHLFRRRPFPRTAIPNRAIKCDAAFEERFLPAAQRSGPATSGPVTGRRQTHSTGLHDDEAAVFESDSITGGQEERARQLEGVPVVSLKVLHQHQPRGRRGSVSYQAHPQRIPRSLRSPRPHSVADPRPRR
ncbi:MULTISPECIES: lytic polysaccharide monooxygenase [Streptomyces]|uniref:lytic polysaccharide monooxygenase n=1 Tax=Streptomyces TaxID=1883 RepID=UPI00192407CA